ncbi:MAG TPA: efflux RND transporter periplasmic adaptor subunit [Candidatus Angelobacter sp.]
MMRKSAFKWFSIVAAVLLVGFGIAFAVQQLRPAPRVIPTTRVQKGTLELDVDTPGELRTPHSAMLVAPSVTGTLQIVRLARTGTQVKVGDVVVEFDPSEQEYNLEQSRSQLAEAEQQIAKAKADAEVKTAQDKVAMLKAKFDVRRAELEVSRNELMSEIDARKNLLNLEEARRRLAQLAQDINSRAASNTASIALLEEKRQTALLGMKQAQRGIDSMQVKSTINGLVSIKENMDSGMTFYGMNLPEYREGDLVYPGRFLAEVLDLDQMEVMAKVYESDRSNLNVGQVAEIRLDAQAGPPVQAKVKSIAGMASRNDFGPNAIGRFEVLFSFLNRENDLRPGISAEILVRGNQIKGQLYLPAQCLFEKDGKQIIYVKRGNNFEPTAATVKFRTENRIAVDLPEGTEVALVNPEELKNQEKTKASGPVGVGQ